MSPRRLYTLCWREHSRRKLSPTLATPTTLVLTTLVAECKLNRNKIGLLLEVVGRKFSHRPGNPATVGVVRWPAAGDTVGSSLRRLSSLQHRIYNLLGKVGKGKWRRKGGEGGFSLGKTLFSRWGAPPSWIFKNSKFLRSVRCKGPTCVTVPNFVKIGQTVAGIWRFNGFLNGGRD